VTCFRRRPGGYAALTGHTHPHSTLRFKQRDFPRSVLMCPFQVTSRIVANFVTLLDTFPFLFDIVTP
jgi:hypothetical protein